jgi:hypothetical protein
MIISQMNTERAAGRVQPDHNLRLKLKNNKKKAASLKPQASSYKRLKRAIIKK